MTNLYRPYFVIKENISAFNEKCFYTNKQYSFEMDNISKHTINI